MTNLKKSILAVIILILYIAIGYGSQFSMFPITLRLILSVLQWAILIILLISLVLYSARSAWKNRRLDSLLLFIISGFISLFMVPVYFTVMNNYIQLIRKEYNHSDNKLDQSSPISEIRYKKDLDELISNSNSKPLVVKISAIWCSPCMQLKPIYKEIAGKLHEKIKFVEIDYDIFDVKKDLKITGLPTIVCYKNGQEVERIVGFTPLKQLDDQIQKACL